MVLTRVRTMFKRYPLLANSAVYGTMCVTAEFSQQVINKRVLDRKTPPEPIDKASLTRYAVVGSCINSNILYFWYRWLDANFVGKSSKIIVKKLLLDQFLLTPQLLGVFYIRLVFCLICSCAWFFVNFTIFLVPDNGPLALKYLWATFSTQNGLKQL
ncbi:unnamed protein product [Nesidiocoris tenuis]|uniref:Mpv17-like protein n=1 Tax=Nesidiocoris tenuis TaxID=355587 RepID=A0A6H5GRN8_9HEMI|nr:unnamed protein product [Nesidiocoris tenuis]